MQYAIFFEKTFDTDYWKTQWQVLVHDPLRITGTVDVNLGNYSEGSLLASSSEYKLDKESGNYSYMKWYYQGQIHHEKLSLFNSKWIKCEIVAISAWMAQEHLLSYYCGDILFII